MVAITPTAALGAVVTIFDAEVPAGWLIFTVVAMLYLDFAIRATLSREHEGL